MSDVKKKIVYSTDPNFIDHDKIRDLQEAEIVHVRRTKEESSAELQPLIKDILGDNPNLTPLISLENFMYFWYPKIEAYIEEGRDIVAEKDPNSSLFLMWGKEHIRPSDGYRVGISRGNKVVVESETNRKKYNFEVLVTTPGITIDPMIGAETFGAMDLEHVAASIVMNPVEVIREQELREFTNDLSRIHDQEVSRSNLEEQREIFRNEWRGVLKKLKAYYEEYKKNGNYLPPNVKVEDLGKTKEEIKEVDKKQPVKHFNDDDDIEWDY